MMPGARLTVFSLLDANRAAHPGADLELPALSLELFEPARIALPLSGLGP